jgi:hypothetical protein
MVVMTEHPSNSNHDRAPHTPEARPYPVLSNRAIICAAAVLVLIGAGLAVTLLLAFGSGQRTAQLEAIKTAGTIVIGTGGAAALWLAARRQRTGEIALNQKRVDQLAADRAFEFQQELAEQNRVHLERVAAATERDASTRRLNDLYLKAVEQLGSDKAIVRLGALFALERVGNEDPKQRQTVVDVICSYLRSPFPLAAPMVRPAGQARLIPVRGRRATRRLVPSGTDPRHQEQDVRITAQRLLARVLRGADDHLDEARCWHNMNLDLIGATLIDLDFTHCRMNITWFLNATFVGETWLNNTVSNSAFDGATFADKAFFDNAEFLKGATFRDTTFQEVTFEKARFREYASFERAVFLRDTYFSVAEFSGQARFDQARFEGKTNFDNTRFEQPPRVAGVHFQHGKPGEFAG